MGMRNFIAIVAAAASVLAVVALFAAAVIWPNVILPIVFLGVMGGFALYIAGCLLCGLAVTVYETIRG